MRKLFLHFTLCCISLLLVTLLTNNNSFAQNITIAGKVHNDVNGLTDNTVNGLGVDSGFVNAVLVNDSTNKVVAAMAVTAGGNFSFGSLSPAPYSVRVTSLSAVIGFTPPAVALPVNWVNTGEYFGLGAGSDGTVDGIVHLDSVYASTVAAQLGIEQRPRAKSDTSTTHNGNPTGVVFYTVNNSLFGGTDYNGGSIDSIRLTSFPTNTTTLSVNSTNYTSTTFPSGGISLATNSIGVPTTANIQVDPVDGLVMVKIPYLAIDNAHKASLAPGAASMPFSFIDGPTAQQLVDYLTGTGVTVLNPQINSTCPGSARGKFNFFGSNDLGIDSGIILTTGKAITSGGSYGVNGPASNLASTDFNGPGDADLNALLLAHGSTTTTEDACALEFDFVPAGDTIKFDYVFGSEEYQVYNCSSFNDVFGFFISGPGFTGLTDIALVPGTNIPVAINSVNGGANLGPACTNMGPGSPFTQYYVDNAGNGGQQITYNGFTKVFTAIAAVTPCDTYHLKLAIGDGTDHILDSGVFLKSGSLNSTGIIVKTFGGGGLETPFTNTVRGCPPGVVRISRTGGFSQPVTIPLQYTGTAVNGVDYVAVPNSVTIPAGDTAVTINISGIPMFPPVGPKTCIVSAISPYNCNGQPVILSSDTITILDSIYVKILNPDTAICWGQSVNLQVEADTVNAFHWSPVFGVSDTTAQNVTVMPDTSTTYKVTVRLPSYLACPPSSDTVRITVKRQPQINLGQDIFTCADSVQLNALTSPVNPDETFSWSPPGLLNNPNVRNPVAHLNNVGTTTFVVTVNPGAIGCNGVDSIRITLLPDHINLLNGDTVVCAGTIIPLFVDGDNHFSYNWTPSLGIANDTLKNTMLTAEQSELYTITASYPSCPAMSDSMYVEVQPNPVVNVGPDQTICSYDTLQLYASVMPSTYTHYSYQWTNATGLNNVNTKNPVFNGATGSSVKVVKVSTPIGCTGKDSLRITVNPGNFLAVLPTDTGVCPPDSVQLNATGGQIYHWQPANSLSNPNIPNPVAYPTSSTLYKLISRSIANCYDTANVYVEVYPSAVVDLPDSVQIWSGESYQMNPGGNALYFSWFPPSGLSADNISNPVASPEVRTRYFVTARTENGCVVRDSIDVLVNTTSVINEPNAFTPGSGANGVFKIERRGFVKLNSFKVFNRWGNLIFETSDINKGWDGTYNGKPQPTGVYVYMVDAVKSDGQRYEKTGNVTLLR